MTRALVLALLFGLADCQAAPPAAMPEVSIDEGTRRVIITYLIAHGMAESYVMSGRATPVGLLDLVRSDHAALIAVRGEATRPTWGMLDHADGAVQALIDTTTALDDTQHATHGHKAASR